MLAGSRLAHRGRIAFRCNGPDFICVGLQKAGTRWLYQQLRGHRDFWMPPIKELNFLNGNFEKEGNLRLIDTKLPKIIDRLSHEIKLVPMMREMQPSFERLRAIRANTRPNI
jgi:hypothetical protein